MRTFSSKSRYLHALLQLSHSTSLSEYVRVLTSPHVHGSFHVAEVEGIEECGRNRTNARHEKAARISGLRLRDIDASGVEVQLARAGKQLANAASGETVRYRRTFGRKSWEASSLFNGPLWWTCEVGTLQEEILGNWTH